MIPAALERVLELSRADQCIVIGWENARADVRWANNTSTTNGLARGTRLFVISVIGRRVGSVGVTHLTGDGLEAVVRRSEAACEGMPEAEDFMPLLPGDGPPAGWEDPAADEGIAVFAELAPALGDAFGRAEADGVKLFGYAEHTTSTCWLATSSGLRRRHTQPEGRFELNAKSPDFARSSWVGHGGTDFEGVDVHALYDRLVQRLGWSATTHELPAGHYQVILEPSAVADMAFYAYASSSARDADEGRTVFSRPGGGNRIGEQLYAPGIDVWSDPADPGLEVLPFEVATSSGSFDSVFDNGLERHRTQWVRDGVLEALVTTRHWADRTGARPTPWVGNLVMGTDQGASLDEMVASTTGRALLVTCFWYIREVDPRTLLLTGLTRDGVFLVEDGEVRGAVNNFRFNMSPVDLLAQTVEIGRSVPALPREFADYFHAARVPALRVDRFNMSSVSRAT